MANTVQNITYANTFGDWVVSTNAVIKENNDLAANNYTKDTGTLYLSDPTLGLEVKTGANFKGDTRIEGVGSSATIQNDLTITSGQLHIQNTTIGLINDGQANVNGLLFANGPGTGLLVANTANVGGKLNVTGNTKLSGTLIVTGNTDLNNELHVVGNSHFISTVYIDDNAFLSANATVTGNVNVSNHTNITRNVYSNNASFAYNTHTKSLDVTNAATVDVLQANSSVNTTTASITGTTYTNVLQANTSANTGTLSVTGTTLTNSLQANTSVNTATVSVTGTTYSDVVQANTSANTRTMSVTGTTFTNVLQANATVSVVGTTSTDILQANTSANTRTLSVTGTTLTNTLQANASVNTATMSVTGTAFSNVMQANTSANTRTLSVTGTTSTDILQANTSANTRTLSVTGNSYSDIVFANTSIRVPTANVTTLIDANNAAGFFNTITTNGINITGTLVAGPTTLYSGTISSNFLVKGDFVIQGYTLLDTNTIKLRATTRQSIGSGYDYVTVNRVNSAMFVAQTADLVPTPIPNYIGQNGHGYSNGDSIYFTSLSTGVTGIANNVTYKVLNVDTNKYQVATVAAPTTPITFSVTGTGVATDTGKNDAQIRWNEPNKYWDLRDVDNSNDSFAYSRILTGNMISDSVTTQDGTLLASSRAANTVNSYVTSANAAMKVYVDANVGVLQGYLTANVNTLNSNITANVNATNINISANAAAGNAWANSIGTYANNYTDAKTTYNPGSTITFQQDVVINSSLWVKGTTTQVDSTVVKINDPLIKLANNNTLSDVVDVGFYSPYYTGTTVNYAGLARSSSGSKEWILFKGLTAEPTSTLPSGTFTTANSATLWANIYSNGVNLYDYSAAGYARANSSINSATADTINGVGLTATVSGSDKSIKLSGTLTSVRLDTTGGASQITGVLPVLNGGSGVTVSTGTGYNVLNTSPILTTPTLGVASATSVNKVAITAPATGSTLTIADGKTLTACNTLSLSGTDGSGVAFGAGGTVAYKGTDLGQFASTTSAQLAGVLSDETGYYPGALAVFSISPALTTPNIGAATATSVNKVTITAPASGSTLTIQNGKTLTVSNSLTLSASDDSRSLNIGVGGTLGTNAFNSTAYQPSIGTTSGILKGNGSGGISAATSSTDYAPATSGTAILKGNGSGGFSGATSGSDYAPATSGASMLKGNNGGGFTNMSGADVASYIGSNAVTNATNATYTSNLAGIYNQGGYAATIGESGLTFYNSNSSSAMWIYNGGGTSDNVLNFQSGLGSGVVNAQLYSSGNFVTNGTITSNSDRRLKSNIETITNALEKATKLRGVTFDKDGHSNIGVIAQEVREIIPEVVLEANDEAKTLSVAYGNIVGLLIEAIKELKAEVDELKANQK